jgi:hypothetical protein
MFQQLLRRLRLRHKPRRGSPAALLGEGVWQEKKKSVDVQRSRVNVTGFI